MHYLISTPVKSYSTAKNTGNKPSNNSCHSQNNIQFSGRIIKEASRIVVEDLFKADPEKINAVLSEPGSGFNLIPYRITKQVVSPGLHKIIITNPAKDNELYAVSAYKPDALLPDIDLLAGSFLPTIRLTDNETNSAQIMSNNSFIRSKNFVIATGSEAKRITDSGNISFAGNQSGRLFVTQSYRKSETGKAVREYFEKDLFDPIAKGDYAGKLRNKYSIVGIVGGTGSRFANVTEIYGTNKPSMYYPGETHRLIHISVLDMAVRAGIVDGRKIKKDFLANKVGSYDISTGKVLNNNNITFIVEPDNKSLGSGGAPTSALAGGVLPADQPAVFVPGDLFTNIDLSRALKEFEDSNAGFMVVGALIPEEQARKFPLLDLQRDENGKLQINEVCKVAKNAADFERLKKIVWKDSRNSLYAANSVIYIIHPKILKIMKQIVPVGESFGLGHFLMDLPWLLNKKEKMPDDCAALDNYKRLNLVDNDGIPRGVLDDEGKPLKMLACIGETSGGKPAKWNDVGSFPTYISEIRNAAQNRNGEYSGISPFLLKQFKRLADRETGVVYMSERAKDNFQRFLKKYEITEAKGDILVTEAKGS